MKIRFLIFGVLFSLICSAQNQGNIWYFGTHAGLDFNSGTPVYLENGMLDTFEGTASMCNSFGVLLFYTDGVTVYNSEHAVMSNGTGLWGNSHTTQSAVIVPMPGSSTQYLIFTLDYAYNTGNFAYSVVDMAQNNGLGAVILKNVFIQSGCTEKMAAVFHSNHQDIWIIIHERDNSIFKSYRITSSGFVPDPVVSSTGPIITGPQGSLKASADGSLLAMATYHQKTAEIFHFDPSTGMVTYDQGFTYPDATYGVEFSGNQTKLYVSVSYDIKRIYQIDLSAGTNTLIASTGMAPGAMQTGPDGKIYVARYDRPNTGSSYLGVINYPDSSGTACNYNDQAVFLGNGLSKVGLPTMLHYFPAPVTASFFTDTTCSNQVVQFTDLSFTTLGYIQRWIWNFGDGSAVDTINFPESPNVQHYFQVPGSHNVSLVVITNEGYSNTITKAVVTIPIPVANFQYSGSCVNQAVSFVDLSVPNGGSAINSWLWNFGDPASGNLNTSVLPDPVHIYSVPDIFMVSLISTDLSGCSDTLFMSVVSNLLFVDFTNSVACRNQAVSFFPDSIVMNPATIASWLWNFGDGSISSLQSPEHVFAQTGEYLVSLTVTDTLGCTNSATHSIQVAEQPSAIFDYTTSACTSSPVQFTDLSSGGNGQIISRLWDFGDGQQSTLQNPTHIYSDQGTYLACLNVQNECGESTSCKLISKFQDPVCYFKVNYLGSFSVEFINESNFAETVMWDFGDGNISNEYSPIHTFAGAGNYWVCLKVTNPCNSVSYCEMVPIDYNTGIPTSISGQEITISPNPAKTEIAITFGDYSVYQIDLYNAEGTKTDTYSLKDFQKTCLIPLKGKAPGFYLLRFLTDHGILSRELIIQP